MKAIHRRFNSNGYVDTAVILEQRCVVKVWTEDSLGQNNPFKVGIKPHGPVPGALLSAFLALTEGELSQSQHQELLRIAATAYESLKTSGLATA